MKPLRVESKKITEYNLYLIEEYRPPSRGGNTSALHSHVIEIDGENYSFKACGSQPVSYTHLTLPTIYSV